MKLAIMVALATFALPSIGQTQGVAQIFSARDIASQLGSLTQTAKTSGSGGAVLGKYQSHAIQLSVRTASGGAEVHAHYDDIFVVTRGNATLVTGGTIENAQTGSDGETKGKSVQNGRSQTITKDDVVHIPAGTPHQLIIAPGTVFISIVVKVKE
jgi:mannose-6-phosphate isomerase-like protein (cupin superfamily)